MQDDKKPRDPTMAELPDTCRRVLSANDETITKLKSRYQQILQNPSLQIPAGESTVKDEIDTTTKYPDSKNATQRKRKIIDIKSVPESTENQINVADKDHDPRVITQRRDNVQEAKKTTQRRYFSAPATENQIDPIAKDDNPKNITQRRDSEQEVRNTTQRRHSSRILVKDKTNIAAEDHNATQRRDSQQEVRNTTQRRHFPLKLKKKSSQEEQSEKKSVFHGDLGHINIFHVLQMLSMENKTGCLLLLDTGAKIFCELGNMVHCEYQTHSGLEGFYQALAEAKGEFKFDVSLVSSEKTIHAGLEFLLIEAARRLDEDNAT